MTTMTNAELAEAIKQTMVQIDFVELVSVEHTLVSHLECLLDEQHRRAVGRDREISGSSGAAQPDPDGWIPWGGGPCPVDGSDIVEVIFESKRPHEARTWYWDCKATGYRIIAYRPHKPRGGEV